MVCFGVDFIIERITITRWRTVRFLTADGEDCLLQYWKIAESLSYFLMITVQCNRGLKLP